MHLFSGNGTKPHAGAEAHYSALRLEGNPWLWRRLRGLKSRPSSSNFRVWSAGGFRLARGSSKSRPARRRPPERLGLATRRVTRRCAERADLRPSGPHRLARLRESELALEAARRDLLEAARLGHAMTAAAEWLLDNAYLIRTQIAETRRHLPRDYPKLLPGLRARYTCPDVYDLAEHLVAGADHALNEANITECLRQYQTVTPLTIAELWFFPLLLRMALFESLASLATRVSRAQQLREVAYLWANRLAVSMRRGPEEFEKMLARLETEPFALQPCFRYIAGGTASGSGERAGAGAALDRRPRQDAAHRPAAQRTLGGSVAAHFHRQRVRQPPRHFQNRFHEDLRDGQSGGRRTAQRSLGRIRAQRLRNARPMPAGGGASGSGERSLGARCGPPGNRARGPPGGVQLGADGTTRPTICWPTASRNWKLPWERTFPFESGLIRTLRRRATCGVSDGRRGSHGLLPGAGAGAGLGGRRAPATLLAVLGALALFPLSELSHPDRERAGDFPASSRPAPQDGFPEGDSPASTPRWWWSR